jgi:anti-sigma regulatory factor (Ser/Thr protein kinase)
MDGPVVPVVQLLTSELVANAVVHGDSEEIEVALHLEDGVLTVGVRDMGRGMPVVRTTGPEVPGGQGLRLVERLADSVGVDRHGSGGKTVWFRVAATRAP